MATDPIAGVARELLVRQLTGWATAALQRSRRATFVQAYAGADADAVESVLGVFANLVGQLRGRQLTVVVLAAEPGDLAVRLGAAQAGLPAEVSVHLIPGTVDRLPVALKAAGAAGSPVLAVVDVTQGPAPTAATLAALAAGRPAELLLVLGGRARVELDHRQALPAAGFPLVADVELVGAPDTEPAVVAFGTASGKRLDGFKDAIWAVDETSGVRYRDPRDPAGDLLDITPSPSPDPLGRELLARLAAAGRCSVSDLRQYTAAQTLYRAADANRALADLLDAGLVSRDPVSGRLAGDVLIDAVPALPGPAPAGGTAR
jgi:hypothetical protein